MKDLIQACQDLTRKGDDFIRAKGRLEFHAKAQELLSEACLHEIFDFKQLVHASFDPDFNKNQNYASSQFSDLPITLVTGQDCFLDIYFWRRRPTVIHDHHFTGAFQCIEGNNVDLEFEFIRSQRLGLYHDLGTLNLKKSRILKKGDIAPIDHLDKFIHQNHHQAELTINVCFRTPDIGETNLSNYLYSGLRFEKHPALLDRINRLMSFIHIGDFKLQELNITIDDAVNFLLRNYRSESLSKRFLDVKNFMEIKVKNELGLDVDKYMNEHEMKIDHLENQYN